MPASSLTARALGPVVAASIAIACSSPPPPPPLAAPVTAPPPTSAFSPARAEPAPEVAPVPDSPTSEEFDPAAAKPEGLEPSWKAVLVWRIDRLTDLTTFWLEPASDGGAREVMQRAEPVVATSHGLVAVRQRTAPISVCDDCKGCDRKTHRGCKESRRTSDWWELHDLATNRGTPLSGSPQGLPAASQGCGSSLSGFERHASVSAVGPLVTITTWEAAVRCDSLTWSDAAKTVNVETGAEDELALVAADLERVKKRGAAALLGPDHARCPVDPADPPILFASSFSYNALGALLGTYEVRMRNKSPCQGPSPYNSDEDVIDPALPAAVTPWRRLPAWLVGYAAEHKPRGLSPMPVGQDLDALKKQLAAPLPGGSRAPQPGTAKKAKPGAPTKRLPPRTPRLPSASGLA